MTFGSFLRTRSGVESDGEALSVPDAVRTAKRLSSTSSGFPSQRLEAELERAGSGDRRAFDLVYRLSSPRLLTVCLRILPRRPEAEDALQDAFLTIWERAARFDRARGSAIAWLSVITRNTAIDRRRARAPLYPTGDDEVADPAPAADLDLIAREDRVRVLACLDALDPTEAAFLRTAFLQGVTYAALAGREHLPLGTVKSRIRRALLKMRDRMECAPDRQAA
jgi:RNA polymerase sigma-70 factor, ECF subfamily